MFTKTGDIRGAAAHTSKCKRYRVAPAAASCYICPWKMTLRIYAALHWEIQSAETSYCFVLFSPFFHGQDWIQNIRCRSNTTPTPTAWCNMDMKACWNAGCMTRIVEPFSLLLSLLFILCHFGETKKNFCKGRKYVMHLYSAINK